MRFGLPNFHKVIIFTCIFLISCSAQKPNNTVSKDVDWSSVTKNVHSITITAARFPPYLHLDEINASRASIAGDYALGSAGASIVGGSGAGSLPGAILGILFAPIAATGGAIHGALGSDSSSEIEDQIRNTESAFKGNSIQELFKTTVYEKVSLYTDLVVINSNLIGPGTVGQIDARNDIVQLEKMRKKSIGGKAPWAEASTKSSPISYLGYEDTDMVLETNLIEIGFDDVGFWGNDQLQLYLYYIVRLVDPHSNSGYTKLQKRYGPTKSLDEWSEDNGKLTSSELVDLFNRISDDIVKGIFIHR